MKLYNSLSRQKEDFSAYDPKNVRMYVCGPTVYNRPHIGNARAVVVYDVLFRLLRNIYGNNSVSYARNITDVDDKINAQAAQNGESISELSQRVTQWFHDDMQSLGNIPPTFEPKATEHISEIILMIESIIANNHGYVTDGHVLFDVGSVGEISNDNGSYYYGKLSGKKLEDLIEGARVEVADYKRSAGDFVLWKPSSDSEPGWDSPWGRGRPGWHIECSAMSTKYLGTDFDIHGGGADLKFPHHENEIAQSICSNTLTSFAKYWIHNGFLTVNGEKMSKSLGNFTTVKELLDKGIKGEVIRYVLLATHYRKPLDFSDKSLDDAQKNLDTFYGALQIAEDNLSLNNQHDAAVENSIITRSQNAYSAFKTALHDDMNTPKALAELYIMAKGVRSVNARADLVADYKQAANLIGLLKDKPSDWFAQDNSDLDIAKIEDLIEQRNQAKQDKNWAEADKIRDEITAMGIVLEDGADGTTWRKV